MPVDEEISMTHDEALFNFSNLISIQREGYLKRRLPEKYLDETKSVINGLNSTEITFAKLYANFLLMNRDRIRKKFLAKKLREMYFISMSC